MSDATGRPRPFEGVAFTTWMSLSAEDRQALSAWAEKPRTERERQNRLMRVREALEGGAEGLARFTGETGLYAGWAYLQIGT